MKVSCYRVVPLPYGVEALDLAEVEMPLADVLRKSVAGLPEGNGLPSHTGAPDGLRPVRFKVTDADDRVLEVHGFLLYTREEAVVEFLASHYLPSQNGRIDHIVRTTPPPRLRDEIAAHLRRRRRPEEEPYFLAHRRGPADFVLHHDDYELNEHLAPDRRGRYFFKCEGPLSLVADAPVSYAGRAVPRRRFALALGRNGRRLAWFDGERFGTAAFPDQLPPALAAALESGRPVAGAVAEPLPPAPLEPLFLLRAPGKAEAARVTPGEAPERPFFLLDTRQPVPLPPGLEVVDDPRRALAILSRTSEGVYVPRDIVAPLANVEDEERWYVACRVAS